HVAMQVDEFDVEKNAVHGHDINTGESVTVRFPSSPKEFAALFVYDKDKFDTDEKRENEARRQMRKQPSAESMAEKSKPGSIVQMQNVVKNRNDELVARWGKAVTTSPENQAGFTALVEVRKPYNDNETNPRRSANIVFVEDSFVPGEANLDKLESLLSNNRDGSLPFAFDAKSGVTVAVSTEEEAKGFRLMTGWDDEAREPINGLRENILRQPYDFREANAQTLLAAKVGIPFENLQAPEKADDGYNPEYLASLYDAILDSNADVSVGPTLQGNLMQYVREDVMDSEQREKIGKGSRLSDRGYFPAHIGVEKGGQIPDTNKTYTAGIRQILPTERFLTKTTDDRFMAVYVSEVAARISDVALTKQEAELEAAKKMQNEQERSRTAGQEFGQPAM
ncbi:hypothetical protein SAMN04488527_1471, partial [Aliiroseovarius crassostreae]